MSVVWISGSLDDCGARQVRFLQEASLLGEVRLALWSDAAVRRMTGREPKFPQEERRYFIGALRWVSSLQVTDMEDGPEALPRGVPAAEGDVWAVAEGQDTPARRRFCGGRGLTLHAIGDAACGGFPPIAAADGGPARKKVVVTGCYDWFHSGHVRFFEEVSGLGDLYVVVGNDAAVRGLKGEGHPMFAQAERRYLCGSVRFVRQALVSTGMGWLDAEPEIRILRPDVYAVNADGDKPEKRKFCRGLGMEYRVLARAPKEGLPRRTSTELRGF